MFAPARCRQAPVGGRSASASPGCGPGHGTGVTIPELPYLVEGEPQGLLTGRCFSIEPGIYLGGGFGVRIEDIVTVTGTGGRRLNNTDRHLRIVS